MAFPKLHIIKGPSQRALEQAFIARDLGARATFTLFAETQVYEQISVKLNILNFSFVTCHGPNYELGGNLVNVSSEDLAKLPSFNFIFVEYNTDTRSGMMEFSNAG